MAYKKKPNGKNATGRPKIEIDYVMVEKLASIMATQEEIAAFIGVAVRTLQNDKEFMRIYKKGLDSGRMSLRRKQFKLADKNATMGIWLGKQYLDQKDKPETTESDLTKNLDQIKTIAEYLNNPKPNRSIDD